VGKNKKWSSAQKFEIALQAIRNEMTINDICKKYEVAPSQVSDWKKQLLEHGADLFGRNEKSQKMIIAESEKEKNKLYAKIGELTVERDFLKKSLSKLPLNLDED
jgi:transposase